LTTLFDNPAIVIAPPKKQWSLLPLLVVLFLISYGLMTTLIVEQGQTIQSQRHLIVDLFHDSAALSAIQNKSVRDKQMARAQAHRGAHAPSAQNPSNQVAPQPGSPRRSAKAAKPETQLPPRPAEDLLDQRRILNTI
jgi:hypothetical protein